jgi:hypothetical protein
MPITAFSVGASRTINLGNFESLRVEASVTYELEPDGPPLEKYKDLAQGELRKLLEDTYRNMTGKNAPHIEKPK